MIEIIGNYIINNPVFWVGLLVIILFIIFFIELKKNTDIHRAQRRLDKKKYKILNDVVLESQRKIYKLDTVIISKYGIFVVKYVDYDGKIYGDERELSWIQLKDSK
ncbi:MAG: nuclease-related domain-containing protein, partial [Bacilli bacterium]|nr:nuclease-related domain-containing protein [Bacilli bacterium]